MDANCNLYVAMQIQTINYRISRHPDILICPMVYYLDYCTSDSKNQKAGGVVATKTNTPMYSFQLSHFVIVFKKC